MSNDTELLEESLKKLEKAFPEKTFTLYPATTYSAPFISVYHKITEHLYECSSVGRRYLESDLPSAQVTFYIDTFDEVNISLEPWNVITDVDFESAYRKALSMSNGLKFIEVLSREYLNKLSDHHINELHAEVESLKKKNAELESKLVVAKEPDLSSEVDSYDINDVLEYHAQGIRNLAGRLRRSVEGSSNNFVLFSDF